MLDFAKKGAMVLRQKLNVDKKSGDKANTQNQTQCKSAGNDNFIFHDATTLPGVMVDWSEENRSDVITIWDRNGKVCFVSKSVERLLGYKTMELKGTQWYEKILPEDAAYMEEQLKGTEQTGQIFNINVRDKDGKYIWSECKVERIKDETGNVYYISALRDISDKKEMEEMMIRSEKMSIAGQLAAGVAHEIRNPLTSLKGFIQLLQAGVDRKKEYYKIMIDEIEKMETITSELLFISKPMTDNKQKESIAEMIRDVTELLKPQARLKGITFEWEQSTDVLVHCDRSQIKQVLINLTKNAIEAMEDEGTIHIQVHAADRQVVIDVIDQGPGISEEIIHKLGEPFFTTKQNGTGLGLMITKQILDRHNAKLDISQNADKGSTFSIVFQKAADF